MRGHKNAIQTLLDHADGNDRLLKQLFKEKKIVRGRRKLFLCELFAKRPAMFLSQSKNPSPSIRGFLADVMYAAKEEFQPTFPVAIVTYRHQTVVILVATLFQIMA